MSQVNPIPEGFHHLTAHLVIDGAAEAIEFYKKAFDAEEIFRSAMPGGDKIMHAEIKVGDSMVMIADDFPEWCGKPRNPKTLGASSVTLHRYVLDTDAAMAKAVAAGATVEMEAADAFWGDRYGSVVDPWGHVWSFATHLKDLTPEEMEEAAKQAMQPQ